MEMPKYAGLVRVLAQIGAALGCLLGGLIIFGGLAAFRFGLLAGFSAILGGFWYILGSLAGLGIVYCFLAIVKAQIDTRNAVINYISHTQPQNGKPQGSPGRSEPFL